jgi:N4-(beta-N-acetylglucosaminyl)-L-asparaginase
VQRPVVIASANWTQVDDKNSYYNGTKATAKAYEMIKQGRDTLEAAVTGVNIAEDDPNEDSVGFGGLPNEEGVVELDSAVMHGPTNGAGAVAALREIKNPSSVAKLVMERTGNVMLVGEGALKFATSFGFQRQNLLTERARRAWVEWREKRNDNDSWGPKKVRVVTEEKTSRIDHRPPVLNYRHRGTICCLAVNDKGEISGVASTSGLAYKIPGRISDSPIIGAGLYVDNEIGAAGATGYGEEVIRGCGSFAVVENMRRGATPTEACLDALRRIVKRYPGRPVFQIMLYALNKQGDFGCASIWTAPGPYFGAEFAITDAKGTRLAPCAFLYEWKGESK